MKDKAVIVTGASRGFGFATATAFAREGARVVMAARNPQTLEEAAARIRAEASGMVEPHALDVTRESETGELVDTVLRTHGRVDVLVNNAAGSIAMGGFLGLTAKDWLTAWEQKLQVYVTLSRQVFPAMQRQKGGRIVNVIGAHAARNPSPAHLPVGAISAGLINVIKGLADLGAKDSILVTGVSPSGIEGERIRRFMEARAKAEGKTLAEMEAAEKSVGYSLGRLGRPEEVGDVICFLASARASYISGAVATIDGNVTRGVWL